MMKRLLDRLLCKPHSSSLSHHLPSSTASFHRRHARRLGVLSTACLSFRICRWRRFATVLISFRPLIRSLRLVSNKFMKEWQQWTDEPCFADSWSNGSGGIDKMLFAGGIQLWACTSKKGVSHSKNITDEIHVCSINDHVNPFRFYISIVIARFTQINLDLTYKIGMRGICLINHWVQPFSFHWSEPTLGPKQLPLPWRWWPVFFPGLSCNWYIGLYSAVQTSR